MLIENIPEPIHKEDFDEINKALHFKQNNCKYCIKGKIYTQVYDEDAAKEYLKSIDMEDPPAGVSHQAHIHAASFEAAKRGEWKEFRYFTSQECPHKYCVIDKE